ncbi:MAG: hypothetical protein OEQ53_10080 [Saprospiraceae bacterium]|nr:hypothetical protein [Saprospiraceae bacterium]
MAAKEVIDAVDHAIPQRYLDNLFHIGIAASSSPIDHAADDDDIEWLKKEALHIAEDREAMNATTRILTDIQKAGKFFSSFDGESLMQVPFGIQDKFGDFEYLLGFDNLRLYKDHASIDVVASIYFPLIGDTLYFAATGIQYTNSGGFVTDTKLRLIQDFAVELNQGKSSLIFRGYRPEQDIGTYLSVDCDGISSMQLGVSVAFNPEMIRPMDPHQEFVQSFAQAKYMPGSGISITDLNIPPFYFKDYTDFGFSLDGMSIDLDESSTAINYISTYLEKVAAQSSHGIRSEQWTGFYCENFTLFVGNKYIHTPDGSGIKIRGQHIVMDDLGFTGQLNLEDTDLVSLDQARLGGWSISMDGVHLDILANHLQSFGFDGLIQIPVLEAKPEEAHYIPKTGESSTTHDATNLSALRYSAIVNLDSNSLELNVEKIGEEELSIPMIFADVSFSEGSYVNVKTGNDLTITAHLNGRISLRGNLAGGSNLNVPGVGFSGMAISNKAPYFSVQTFYPLLQSDPASLGMFSLTFQSLSVVDYEPEKFRHQIKRLSIHDLSLSIGNAKDGDTFTITSSLHAMFDVKSTGFKQRWSGRGIEFEKFSFKANLPGVEQVRGEMVFFYGHPTYGDAFAGRGFVRFSFLDTDVEMACMFGNTGRDGYEYSYVDAASVFNTPARDGTETASAFQVKSLLGGYYKNMTRQDLTSFALDPLPADNGLQLGGKHSENKFVPDEGGWGIRGGLIAKFGDGAIAGLRIEYESYPSDGLGTSARFYLEGLVELMPDEKESSIVASKRMAKPGEVPADDRIKEMIVEDFAGTGSLGGYIRIEIAKTPDDKLFNAAMGIHGVAAGVGIAFYGDYYKSKEYWHLLIGKPDNRLQIAYDVKWGDRVGASLALSGYFMIGNSPDIPVEQPPPYAFGEGNQAMLLDAYNLLKSDALTNIYSQQTAALSYGKAIALGASFGITAYVNLFPIVVDAGADIGFDVLMLRQAPTCNEHNVGVRGVNGWYLKGQMYAGISAKVGIAVGKPGKEKYFKIFQGGVAAVLQGAAFNPTWGIGSWVIQFQVLFIKGSAHGVFRFGEPCANIIQPQIAKDLIENIYPSRPQLAISTEEPGSVGINSDFLVDFSMPVHRSVVESVVNFQTGESNDLKLSLRCQAYITYDDGSSIASDTFVRNEGYTLLIRPKTMLRPGAEVRLHINAKIFDDQGIYNIEGEVFTVDTMVAFQVDPRGILSLTTEDIVVSYPMLGQQFFHPEEYPQMMIDFGKDISDVDVCYQALFIT